MTTTFVVRNAMGNPKGATVLVVGGERLKEHQKVEEEWLLEHLSKGAVGQLIKEGFFEPVRDQRQGKIRRTQRRKQG